MRIDFLGRDPLGRDVLEGTFLCRHGQGSESAYNQDND
jgi:hypothetical protein